MMPAKGELNRSIELYFWLDLLEQDELITVDQKGVITIPPLKKTFRKLEDMPGSPGQALQPILTFGSGDWEELKKMRENNCHPVALWHPGLKSSLVHPDGYWIGALAHWHDFHHIYKTNQLEPALRDLLLKEDSALYTPVVKLCADVAENGRDGANSEHKLFLKGLEQLFAQVQDKIASYSRSCEMAKGFP